MSDELDLLKTDLEAAKKNIDILKDNLKILAGSVEVFNSFLTKLKEDRNISYE